MKLEEKIVFTILFIFGYFVLKAISKRNNKILKKNFESRNPKLAKTNWRFSKRKQHLINLVLGIMTLLFLILIWPNQIVIPINNKENL